MVKDWPLCVVESPDNPARFPILLVLRIKILKDWSSWFLVGVSDRPL